MTELTHYINGQRVSGNSGRFGDVFNPATGEVQARVPLASKEEFDIAVKIATGMGGSKSATTSSSYDEICRLTSSRYGQTCRSFE